MKKKIIYLIAVLFIVSINGIVTGQNQPINFEPGGFGANWTWTVFENNTNPQLEIVSNPDMSGINTSSTVAKFTALQAGNPWAGCESAHGTTDLGPFVLNETNSTIKIMVWKSVISDVGIKLVSTNGWAQPEKKVSNTLVNQWEELTFNFTGYLNPPPSEGPLDQIVIFPDFDLAGRTQDNIIYFDNITFFPEIPIAGPTVAAPVPTNAAINVISVFSDVYNGIPGTDYNPNWGQATAVSFPIIQGDTTMRYENLNYQGIQLGSNQDLTTAGMLYLHIDFWNVNSTDLGVFLISPGPVEKRVSLIPPGAIETWVSVDIPLIDFAPVDLSNIIQLKFEGNGTIYLDNIYFYKGTVGPTVPTVAAPTPSLPANEVISVFSDVYANLPGTNLNPFWGQSTTVSLITIQGDTTMRYSNLDYQGIELGSNQNLTAAGMQFLHIDFWAVNSTDLGVFLISPGPVETRVNLVPPGSTETWVSVNIPLTDFAPVDLSNVIQFKFDGNGTIYLDNIFFSTSISDVKEFPNALPSNFSLEQNYPNPFNPTTNISFSLPEAGNVTLKVHNLLGQEVTTILNQFMNPGKFEITFNASDLPSGIYTYSLSTGDYNSVKKMILIK